jgi:hypothetical protein
VAIIVILLKNPRNASAGSVERKISDDFHRPSIRSFASSGLALRLSRDDRWVFQQNRLLCQTPQSSLFIFSRNVDMQSSASAFYDLQARNATGICHWPNAKCQSGRSETQTRIVLASAMEKTALQMRLINYVPCQPAPEAALGLPNGFKPSGRMRGT